MGTVEDIRQVLQDFLAPELRAINARLDAIDRRFQAVDQRFDDMMTVMNSRFEIVNARFDSVAKDIAQVKDMLEIDRRLARLESKQSQVA